MPTRNLGKLIFSRWAAFLHDLICVPVALFLTFWLRFNLGDIPEPFMVGFEKMLMVTLPVQVAIFVYFGLYRGFWRFASLPDLARIVKAVLVGSVLAAIVSVVFLRISGIPRTVFALYPLLLVISLASPRLIFRYLKDHHLYLRKRESGRALIVGAGRAGESLVSDIISSQEYQPLGFLDDDSKKQGREIHGVRVLGPLEELGDIADRLDIEVILLAIPSADRSTIQKIVRQCAKAGLPCKSLPSLVELTGQKIETGQLRPITVDDLLGREPVKLDEVAIAGYLKGKSVMVTGGGGSIGSELCRQVAKAQPRRLIVYEHSEFNIYTIEQELSASFPDLDLVAVLGDVKISNRLDWVFREFRPEVVFHAAAYKHVPMLEKNPAEGIFNNVVGTKAVADAADFYGVKRFVLVSTDKAVNPANVMGATKRIAELYCQNLAARSKTKFITTRFGNVLGSAGSVVPLFEKQIKDGGPLTVTHRDITRYFMTIPESVSLILQAGSMGKGGEIYVLDMGEPILIRHLAEQMIRLSGFKVGEDIKIVYTGLRPGEKLYEEIFHDREGLMGTEHPKLQLAKARQVEWEWLTAELEDLRLAAMSRDVEQLVTHLKNIVPEFSGGQSAIRESKIDKVETKLKLVS